MPATASCPSHAAWYCASHCAAGSRPYHLAAPVFDAASSAAGAIVPGASVMLSGLDAMVDAAHVRRLKAARLCTSAWQPRRFRTRSEAKSRSTPLQRDADIPRHAARKVDHLVAQLVAARSQLP